jgi:aspartyl-tRNA(Asn)/glutamyl-tRNA(Gln) amidotransferase subunit C
MNHLGTIELATDRLTLRRFEIEDAENMYYNWAGDPEVTKYLTWPTHSSVEVTEKVISDWVSKYNDNKYYMWAIELNELEQPIGTISAVHVDDNIESVELGYCIGKAFWNQGYSTEALTEVIRFFIGQVGAGRVSARHDVNNPNSGKVMAAAGMTYEGTLRRSARNNSGICDMACYAKIRSAALDEAPDETGAEGTGTKAASTGATRIVGEDGIERNYISDETMEYVGILAKLELSPEEAEAARKDMAEMLDYIDQLNELDTTGIEPMSHVFPVTNVFREDVVTNGDGSAATLKNAPLQKDGGFKVPKTIGE